MPVSCITLCIISWLAMVDYITVLSKKDIRVTFKDGTKIKA